MRRIVVNVCLKYIQKRKLPFKDIEGGSTQDIQVAPYIYGSLSEDDLMKLISQLPDGYRIVFNLNVIEGYSHEEIGVMLGIEASTSRSQLVKARRMLQNQIIKLEKIAV